MQLFELSPDVAPMLADPHEVREPAPEPAASHELAGSDRSRRASLHLAGLRTVVGNRLIAAGEALTREERPTGRIPARGS
jgi:hypothetical protein